MAMEPLGYLPISSYGVSVLVTDEVFLSTLPFGRDSFDRQESQPAFSLRPEMSAYRLHILRFRSSSRSMRFIFLVQK